MKTFKYGLAYLAFILSLHQVNSLRVQPEDCLPACHNEQYCCRVNFFSYDCYYFPSSSWQCSEMITTNNMDTVTYAIAFCGFAFGMIGFWLIIFGIKQCFRNNNQNIRRPNEFSQWANRQGIPQRQINANSVDVDNSSGLPSYSEAVNNEVFYVKT